MVRCLLRHERQRTRVRAPRGQRRQAQPGHMPGIRIDRRLLRDTLHATTAAYDDVAQLCGGAGDTAALLVRRGYRGGPNFDLVAGINLLNPEAVRQVEHYAAVHKPKVMLLSTPCTGMKGVRRPEQAEEP